MLATIDRLLAPVTWLAAAFAVVVLLVGPEAIGAKKQSRYTTGAPATGAPPVASAGPQVFASAGCGGCHTFKAAGASGAVGPNLDDLKPEEATVEATVRSGAGTMPAFQGRLSDAQIKAVAQYVATSAGG